MATYNLTILIESAILKFQSSDNLCIARKVGGSYTTVFQDASIRPKRASQKTLISSNSFQWTDKYRVLATATYAHGMLVKSVTNYADVDFGLKTTFTNGSFSPSLPAGQEEFANNRAAESHEDSFLANLIPSTLHTAVELWVQGTWAPIYVDPDNHNSTVDKQLTPLNEYMLFCDNRVQTSSMIDESKFSYPFIFSFNSGSKDKTVRFGYAVPEKPSPNEAAKFYTV